MRSMLCSVVCVLAGVLAAGDVVIDDMKSAANWKMPRGSKEKPAVTAEGLTFSGPGIIVSRTFSMIPADGGKDLQKPYQGIAFKVKGDGSDEWGTFAVTAGPTQCGQVYFPLKNTGITEYRVSFADLDPASDHTLTMPATVKAGELTELRAGDRWKIGQNNYPRKKFSFQLSDVRLIEKIAPKYTPGKSRPAPLKDVVAKMKSGKKVLILCFGDSITAGTSLRNRDRDRYATVLQSLLRRKYKNDQITVRSVAVGGGHTYDSISWLDRDLADGMPDAATMLIGYNNCSAKQSGEIYTAQLRLWIEKFAMKTGCKAPVVLIPTVPGVPRFYSQQYMARATRAVAKEYGLAVAPVDTAIEKLGPQTYRTKYLADSVHPNPEGHKLFAGVLLKTFAGNPEK